MHTIIQPKIRINKLPTRSRSWRGILSRYEMLADTGPSQRQILSHRTKPESPLAWDRGLYSEGCSVPWSASKKKKKRGFCRGWLAARMPREYLGWTWLLNKEGKNLPLIGWQIGKVQSDWPLECLHWHKSQIARFLVLHSLRSPWLFARWKLMRVTILAVFTSRNAAPAPRVDGHTLVSNTGSACGLPNEPRVLRANQQGQGAPKDHACERLRDSHAIFLSEHSAFWLINTF